MAVLPRPDMRRILSRLGNPICTAIVHTPAKDSRASPGPARQDRSARSCHGPATVRWQARFPRRGKRREDTAGNWRAALHAELHAEPSGQRPVGQANDPDRPVMTPEVPGIDLPWTCATGRRPDPATPPARPILPMSGSGCYGRRGVVPSASQHPFMVGRETHGRRRAPLGGRGRRRRGSLVAAIAASARRSRCRTRRARPGSARYASRSSSTTSRPGHSERNHDPHLPTT